SIRPRPLTAAQVRRSHRGRAGGANSTRNNPRTLPSAPPMEPNQTGEVEPMSAVKATDDIREDDAQAIINALLMVKGVARVEPVPADYQLHIATQRAKGEIGDRLRALLRELEG